jgi:hypothetical protein
MMDSKYTFGRFVKLLLIVSLITFILAAYPVSVYATNVQIYSIALGFLISLINALIGYCLSIKAFGRSVKSFMVMVFGGMGIRLLIVMIFLLLILQFTTMDALSLTGSVFFFYTIFISLEIYFLHKMSRKAKTAGSDGIKTENKV